MIAYLDNASTTKPSAAAKAAALETLTDDFGNPSSPHTLGQAAERIVKRARRGVAEVLGAASENVVFTGSGTEAANLAIRAAFKNIDRVAGRRVITSAVEHPAVAEPLARLEALGAVVVRLPVNAVGCVSLESFEDALAENPENTALISIMHVNNETGVLQPVPALAIAKSRFAAGTGSEILFHTDAVQSYAKLPVDIGADGFHHVDLLSFSAHKIHGPKGVGALYAARPEKLAPLILGGGQENGVRSGTENVPGVAGFGAAAMEAAHGISSAADRAIALRSRLLRGIEDEISDIRVNSPREASGTGEAGLCSPYILNVSFLGTRGEVVLHDLERRGVFVSTGSACASIGKGARKISPTLAALGLTAKEAEGAIRFGLSRYSSEGEIDYALEHLKTAVARFRKLGSFR